MQCNGVQSRGSDFARTGQREIEVGMDFGASGVLYAPGHNPSLLE